MSARSTRIDSTLALALASLAASVGPALGQAACEAPAFAAPAPGEGVLADGWTVEGPLTAYSKAERSLTVDGVTFLLPGGADPLGIDTGAIEQRLIDLECLVDPLDQEDPPFACVFDRQVPTRLVDADNDPLTPPVEVPVKDVLGGTVIAGGAVVPADGQPAGCYELVADRVRFEFLRHRLTGVFDFAGSTPADAVMRVNGRRFELNQDPRLPVHPTDPVLLDRAGDPTLALQDLLNDRFKGSLIVVDGYTVQDGPGESTLHAVLVRTEAASPDPDPGIDVVVVDRAEWRRRELRVEGLVRPAADLPGSVGVHVANPADTDASCAGARIGTASVERDRDFELRNRDIARVDRVCVVTANGAASGAAQVDVAVRLD